MAALPGRAAIQVLLCLCTAVTVAVNLDAACKLKPTPARLAAEIRLSACLMHSYNQNVRPAAADGVVKIDFQMAHLHVLEMNTKTGVLRALAFLKMSWIDPQLMWEPSDYESSVIRIRIPAKKIWTPGIVHYDNAGDHGMSTTEALAAVRNNGNVTWSTLVKLSTACYANMRKFPFDQHECFIVFGSWTYNNTQVELKLMKKGNQNVTYHGNSWNMETASAHEYHAEKEDGGDPFSNVAYAVTMLRMPAFYQETLMMPTELVAILTMCMFFVPLATGERLIFGIGLLLASVSLLLNLEDAVSPDTGETPSVAIYLAFVQVMLTAGIILSITVYNCHHRNLKRCNVPACLKTVFLGRLSRLLCVPAEPYTRLPRGNDADLDMSPFPYDSEPTTDAASAAGNDRALEATLQDIRKYLKICATSGGDSTSNHEVLNEWMQLARVVDRLLFVIFFGITLLVFIIGPRVMS